MRLHGLISGGLIAAALVGSVTSCARDSERLVLAPSSDSSQASSSTSLGWSGFGNYLAGLHALQQNDLNAATDYMTRALAYDPDNVELLQRSYLAFAAAGRIDKAAEIANRLITFNPDASFAAIVLAERQAKSGDWAGVEARATA